MQRRREALTLVEVLIMVLILAIISMIAMPQFTTASDEARESALLTDIQTARSQIKLYTTQHAGRLPHVDENGEPDTDNLVNRITGRTDIQGRVDANGPFGPYLLEWPENPFSLSSVARNITFGTQASPPRDNTTGWHYNTNTGVVSANSEHGGESLDP